MHAGNGAKEVQLSEIAATLRLAAALGRASETECIGIHIEKARRLWDAELLDCMIALHER